jgi:hypothetical protein
MSLYGIEWRERGYGLCLGMYIWAGPKTKKPLMVSDNKNYGRVTVNGTLKGICIRNISNEIVTLK